MAQPEQQTIEITVTPLHWDIANFTTNISDALNENDNPELGFTLEHLWDLRADEDYIGLALRIHVTEGTETNAKEIALLEFRGNFRFAGLKRFEQQEGLGLPAQPLQVIAAMTLDTARGVLLGLGRGTVLERAALPPLPPTVLFPQQVPPMGPGVN